MGKGIGKGGGTKRRGIGLGEAEGEWEGQKGRGRERKKTGREMERWRWMWRERGASDEVGSLKQFELKLYSQVKPVTYIRSALLLDDNTFIHSECQDTSAIQT